MPNIDDKSILPPRYRLMPAASATYEIKANSTLPVPVKIRMEHCAILKNEDELILMVTHGGPPYYFQPLPGANFPLKSSYGEIDLKSFCLLHILWNLLGYYEMRLSIQIFYHEDRTATFAVTKNLKAHITAVKDAYKHIRYEDMPMTCESTTDAITLSIPADLKVQWHIRPTFEPARIMILDINTYEPGETCPKIKLRMQWRGSGDPKEETVDVQIHGGSITSFVLLCSPTLWNQHVQTQKQTPSENCTQPCTGKLI